MRAGLVRGSVIAAIAATAVLGVTVASSASADTDPITGGSSTLDISLSNIGAGLSSGVAAIATKPATVTYDTANKVVEYAFPVIGGDGSTNTLYGDVKHGGGLIIVDSKTKKSVTLNAITFTVQDDTISATPAGSTKPVILFDALGNHDYSTTQPETFTSSDVQFDAAGAAYLNKALGAKLFKAGQHVGSFATSFTNSVDAG